MAEENTSPVKIVEFRWYLGLIWSTDRDPPNRREVRSLIETNRHARRMMNNHRGMTDRVINEWRQRNARADTTGPLLLMENAVAIFWKGVRPMPPRYQLEHELMDDDENRAVIQSMMPRDNSHATLVISPLLMGRRWFLVPDYTLRARSPSAEAITRTATPTERPSSENETEEYGTEGTFISPSYVDIWGYTIPAQYREGPANAPGMAITTQFQLTHTSPWIAAECFIQGAIGVTMNDIHTVIWSVPSQHGIRIRFHNMAALMALISWITEINGWGGFEIKAARLVDYYLFYP